MSNPLREVGLKINEVIGQLDRTLSEFLHLTEDEDLDIVDAQTLKHHADDLIGVGQKALETIQRRALETIQERTKNERPLKA